MASGRGVISTPNVVVFALIRFVENADHLVARQLDFHAILVQRFGANNDFFRLFRGLLAKHGACESDEADNGAGQ